MYYRVTYLDRTGHRAHAYLTAEDGESVVRLAKSRFDDVLKIRQVECPHPQSQVRVGMFAKVMFFAGIAALIVILCYMFSDVLGR